VPAATASLAPQPPHTPRPDKGLVALCAVGLVAWQLRRKQAALRSGQLYRTERPRVVASAQAAHAKPEGGVVNAGVARAAR
jgi:hypothetical protein